jgi:hypothetical protein
MGKFLPRQFKKKMVNLKKSFNIIQLSEIQKIKKKKKNLMNFASLIKKSHDKKKI